MTILVAGLGVSGQAVIQFLLAQGDQVFAFDASDRQSATLHANFPEVKFAFGVLPVAWLEKIQLLVLSPGIDPQLPWVKAIKEKGVPVVGEVELFCRAVPADKSVVAITGSNGKSTVTTLVGELLQAQGYRVAVGGNLGTPAIALFSQQPEVEVYVLELSSFQLETTFSLQARTAVVLNISPDHLDRYGEMAAYIAAKAPLYEMTALAVVNRDDAIASALCPMPVKQSRFGLVEPTQPGDVGVTCVDNEEWLTVWQPEAQTPERWMASNRLQLLGRHNVSNCLAAIALSLPFGLTSSVANRVLSSFAGLSHRTQLVKVRRGVRWINDSKGTNVGSTQSALMSFGQAFPVILLAGGQGKGQDFSVLSEPLRRFAKTLIVFGEDASQLASQCAGSTDIRRVDTLAQAVTLADELSVVGDVVLLSPACASFDQFQNYGHRGRMFVELVSELGE